VGTKDRNVRLSHTVQYQERINRGIMIEKILFLIFLLVLNKWNRNGTVMVLVPVTRVPVTKVPVLGANCKFCTGTDEEMRDLGGEPARTMTPEEEEELLNYSEEEGTGTQTGGGEDEEMKDADSEEARQRAEKEAEESDRLAKLAVIQERIRRRKAEKERRVLKQKKKEDELRQAEQDRIRADGEQSRLSFLAEEERRIHLAQIQRLEEELRKAKENADYGEEEEHGGEHSQKRGRSLSQDSRQESTVSGTLGANLLNLPAGYRAVRSTKLNSLAVRHLNGGSAIPFQPIGSFANDRDARVKYANKISDSLASRNISSSFNLANFVCNTCTTRGEHIVLGKNSDGNDGTGQIPPLLCAVGPKLPSGNSGGRGW
jgi:hypothetical protein